MICVRPATAEDVPTLMELARHSRTASQWSEEAYRTAVNPAARPERMVLVIEEAAVLGFVVAQVLADEWEIENIAVSAPARRRGLASRLVSELLQRAKERGAREVFLEVRESNRAARMLYEKWAFLPAGRRKAYYTDPVEDALLFRFNFPQQAPKPVEGP